MASGIGVERAIEIVSAKRFRRHQSSFNGFSSCLLNIWLGLGSKGTKDVKKKLPEFKNETDEREFWATADSTVYVDWRSGKREKLVHLKPSLNDKN